MSLRERLLIGRLRARDEKAFRELVEEHRDRVFNLTYRMLGNKAEAEDVAQEVFIAVFKTVDTFREESKLSTWIYRVAVNHCKNRIKYLARRHQRDQQELDEHNDPGDDGALRCPECGGELGEARQFNLMFETFMGPVRDDAARIFLRPETAQGIFVNFKNVLQFARKKPPFGIAQIGKSFRNEITPGNFVFRTREFEQMEMEFFVPPDEAPRWYDFWKAARFDWYAELGIREDHLRLMAG